MRDENHFTFRSKVKLILQKLVKIFGFVIISEYSALNENTSLFETVSRPYVISFRVLSMLNYLTSTRFYARKERRRKGTSTIGRSVITKVDDEDEFVDDNETTFTVRPKLDHRSIIG